MLAIILDWVMLVGLPILNMGEGMKNNTNG